MIFAAGALCALLGVFGFAVMQGEAADGAATRAAVTVDGVPITDHQVRALASRLGAVAEPSRTRLAFERLVKQQLLANAAVAEGLANEPRIEDALRDARMQILAQMYVDRKTAGLPAPTDAAISAYFDAHRELFAERKIYRMQELAIEATGEELPQVEAQYAQITKLNDMVAWLDSKGLAYRTGAAERTAETLPADLLPHLAKLKEGETVRIATDAGMTILQMLDTRKAPLTLEQARPAISRFLSNQAKGEALQRLTEQLRAKAKVEYAAAYSPSAERGKE